MRIVDSGHLPLQALQLRLYAGLLMSQRLGAGCCCTHLKTLSQPEIAVQLRLRTYVQVFASHISDGTVRMRRSGQYLPAASCPFVSVSLLPSVAIFSLYTCCHTSRYMMRCHISRYMMRRRRRILLQLALAAYPPASKRGQALWLTNAGLRAREHLALVKLLFERCLQADEQLTACGLVTRTHMR